MYIIYMPTKQEKLLTDSTNDRQKILQEGDFVEKVVCFFALCFL